MTRSPAPSFTKMTYMIPPAPVGRCVPYRLVGEGVEPSVRPSPPKLFVLLALAPSLCSRRITVGLSFDFTSSPGRALSQFASALGRPWWVWLKPLKRLLG